MVANANVAGNGGSRDAFAAGGQIQARDRNTEAVDCGGGYRDMSDWDDADRPRDGQMRRALPVVR
jgi:hypothetical protein